MSASQILVTAAGPARSARHVCPLLANLLPLSVLAKCFNKKGFFHLFGHTFRTVNYTYPTLIY